MENFVAAIYYLLLIFFALIFEVVCWAFIFKKFNEKWWKIFIPFYNFYIVFKSITGNGFEFLIFLIPLFFLPVSPTVVFMLSLILVFYSMFQLSVVFGFKGADAVAFTVGLTIITPVFLGILAFSKREYVGVKVDEGI
ncbi:MAG: DUF5684 domain-containing protein [Lachnospiraceae bacterium]|nr:DUF5684 domain-containing protein [Lachnospiraceae bacterium]